MIRLRMQSNGWKYSVGHWAPSGDWEEIDSYKELHSAMRVARVLNATLNATLNGGNAE